MENHIKYSKGVSWINDVRIPFVDEKLSRPINDGNNNVYGKYKLFGNTIEPQGRFPANLLVSDDMLNDGNIGKGNGIVKKSGFRVGGKSQNSVGLNGVKNAPDNYGDKGTNSRFYSLDKWFDNLIDV